MKSWKTSYFTWMKIVYAMRLNLVGARSFFFFWFGLNGFLRVTTINAGDRNVCSFKAHIFFSWCRFPRLPLADKNIRQLIILIISNCICVYTFTASIWLTRSICEFPFTQRFHRPFYASFTCSLTRSLRQFTFHYQRRWNHRRRKAWIIRIHRRCINIFTARYRSLNNHSHIRR